MTDMRLLLFVMAKNEEKQLEETVRGLQAVCPGEQTVGIVLYLARDATEGCLGVADSMQNEAFLIPVEVIVQTSSDIPAGIQAVLNKRRDVSHVMFLASDNNIKLEYVTGLIERAAKDPHTVYKFSRALPGGCFSSQYSALAVRLYLLFCAFVRLLYRNDLTDPAFLVGIFPVELYSRHKFKRVKILTTFFEFVFSLMRDNVPIVEAPVVNIPRIEGTGRSKIHSRLRYVGIAVSVRFQPTKKFQRGESDHE